MRPCDRFKGLPPEGSTMSERIRDWVRRLRESALETTDRPSVLVPVEILAGEAVPPGTFDLLSEAHVVLLGYQELPEQTPPGQARMQFEARAEGLLDDIADGFADAGAAVDAVLAFTHDAADTIDRVSGEFGCEARLVVNQLVEVEDVLLAVTPELQREHVVGLLASLLLVHEPRVRLVDAGEGVSPEDVERVRSTLVNIGFPADAIEVVDPDATRAVPRIVEAAATVDVVVLAEAPEGIGSLVLGETAERVSSGYVGPVLLVHPLTEERPEP